MGVLAGLIALLGMAGVVVALVMLIVQFLFKRGWTKKRIWTVGAVSLVLFVVGVVMGVSSVPDGYKAGYKAGQQAVRDEKVTTTSPAPSPTSTPSVEPVNNQVVVEQPKPGKTTEEATTDKTAQSEQKDKGINIPELLSQDYKGIVQILGKPAEEKTAKSDERIVKYALPAFELEIKLFLDKPISIDITPLKEYKFASSTGYAITDVPDDIMQLLQDMGFSKASVTGEGDTPETRLFSYVDYGSPLREYEIRVNSEDWRAVNEGKTSKVSWVYIKLIKTK